MGIFLFIGFYGIYWSQATRVTPMPAPYPLSPSRSREVSNASLDTVNPKFEVRVYGCQSSQGVCILHVYDKSEKLDQPDLAILREKVEIVDGVAYWSPTGLAKGVYAITAFEDSNLNGKLDRDRFGIPNEAYGYSKNPVVAIGAPQFHDVAFSYDGQTQVDVDIYLRSPW